MNLIPPFLRKQKSLADVSDEELFSKFSRQELMTVSRMVADAKARDFIEVHLGVKITKFTGYDSYLRAGCTKVWASMRAVHLISALVISANFKVVDTKSANPDEAVEPKPREQEWSAFAKGGFIAKPNPYDTWEELVELTVAHLEFTGNAYWVKEDFDLLGRPTAVYPLLPQYVELVPDVRTKVAMYEYTVQGKTLKFTPDKIIHFKYPHPNSLMLGLGSIESGEEIYKKAIGETDLKLKFLENGAQPSGVMTLYDSNVTDEEEWEKLRKKFTKEYGGRKNAGKVAFLNGKWAYHRLGLTTDEMQAIESEKWTIEQIFMNHGVPLSIAGVRNSSNYATARMEEANFRRYKIVPVIDIIVGKINADGFMQAAGAGLKLTYELYGVIDVEQIAKVHLPLMREGVLTRNEMREMIGLRRIENPSMDQIMVTMNTVPIELAGLANLSNLDTMRIFGEILGGEVEEATDVVPTANDPDPEDKPEIPINTVTPDKGGKGVAPLRTYPAKPSRHAKGRKGGR